MTGGVWPWRRRAAEAQPRLIPPPAAVRLSDAWAQAAVLPWAARTLPTEEYYASTLAMLNETRHDVYVFDLRGGEVLVREKHIHHPLAFNRRIEHFRVQLYRDHLRQAVAHAELLDGISLALGVGDLLLDVQPSVPVFAYQKQRDAPWILMPDVELLETNFYGEEDPDTSPDAKLNRVVFAGSSTGRSLTEEDVREDRGERLRYAARFVGDPHVEYSIGRASECVTEEARAALEAKPYFRFVGWPEQLRRRYILSLDGNGAACSRVARTLRSRSTLIKGRSDHVLFYFPGLLPWRHYIPVESEAELEELTPFLTLGDFPSAGISEAANAFWALNMSAEAVTAYTARVLTIFNDVYIRRLG